jgi:hypothetical protein
MRTRRSQVSPSRSPRSIAGGSRALLVVIAALASGACSKSGDHVDQPTRGGLPVSSPAAATSLSPAAPPPRRGVLRPNDLLDAPASYLGRDVDLVIVEPLSGPPTVEALARADYGQIRVEVPDNQGKDLALVPAGFRQGDPNRYRLKFDRVIEGPVRVHGIFESDDDLATSLRHPAYVLRVASITPLEREAPARLGSTAEIDARRDTWDRRLVVYEGVWTTGFEVSMLDDSIWLSPARGVTEVGASPARQGGRTRERVRVTGILFAKPGALYGHLGSGRYQLLASRIEHLGAP